MKRYLSFIAVAAMIASAACASHNAIPSLQGSARTDWAVPNFKVSGDVYVSMASQIAVFGPTGKARVATISQPGRTPTALAFDRASNLYVGAARIVGNTCGVGSVTRYPAGSIKAKAAIDRGVVCPVALAFNKHLYVLNADDQIAVYNPATRKLLYTITAGLHVPTAMAFDHNGNLYVANNTSSNSSSAGTGNVTMYPRKAKAPTLTISFRNSIPLSLAVDSHNNLYVGSTANLPFSCSSSSSSSSAPVGLMTELAPRSTTVVRKIAPLLPVTAVTIDSSDNLYVAGATVANACSSSSGSAEFDGAVAVFPPGTTTASRTIVMNDPFLMALDDSENLYVADCVISTCSTTFVIREVRAHGARILRNLPAFSQPTALAAEP
ncbi:MAG TPA: hypothetical protein VGG89_00010 [Candidatus Baltobacteraceae bacterium]